MPGREGRTRKGDPSTRVGADGLRHQLVLAAAEWRATFDAISSPILVLDLKRNIRRLNRAARDLTSRSFAELIGAPVTSVGGGSLFAAAAVLSQRAIASRSVAAERVSDPTTGTTWSVVAHLRGAQPEVQEEMAIVVASDITRIEALQESLRRSETLNVLGTAVAGLAHRVRNPLFGISAALDAFDARFGEQEDLRRYAVALREPVGRLAQLLEELLKYAGPAGSPTHATDLSLVVSAAVRSCAALTASQQVAIQAPPATEPLPVKIDTNRVQNAFINLIENAIQASPANGLVTIELDAVADGGQRWARFRIRDSGSGFRDEDLPHLGEPFFSRRHGSTGLGLAFVQRVVFESAGSIAFVNHTDGGAEVDVRIPFDDHQREEP